MLHSLKSSVPRQTDRYLPFESLSLALAATVGWGLSVVTRMEILRDSAGSSIPTGSLSCSNRLIRSAIERSEKSGRDHAMSAKVSLSTATIV